jgi:hypothetical protein
MSQIGKDVTIYCQLRLNAADPDNRRSSKHAVVSQPMDKQF